MGGSDGNRGYLVQTVIGLLELINSDAKWDRLTLEPSHSEDQADIFVEGASKTSAIQVKSTINQISIDKAKKWAIALENASTADELRLVLIGHCSKPVARMGQHGKVVVPPPKTLDLEGLLSQAAHELHKFLVHENKGPQDPTHLELMVKALVTELSVLASGGHPYERKDFISQLMLWTNYRAITSHWETVDFSAQRNIDAAVSGQRLGPSDVSACPKLPGYRIVVLDLERSHYCFIVGPPGCGKSITVWQAAYKFHEDGYIVWRPTSAENPQKLLDNKPKQEKSLIVIDDAQRFDKNFRDKLSECASESIKVLLSSTISDTSPTNLNLFPTKQSVSKLGSEVLKRSSEILPIIQLFDNWIGNEYGQTPFDFRVNESYAADTPWEFFWLLRGGWNTAYSEYRNLLQFANTNTVLNTLAISQIVSCDKGVSHLDLVNLTNLLSLNEDETNSALLQLESLHLISKHDGVIRTKHVRYAEHVLKASLSEEHMDQWANVEAIVKYHVIVKSSSLQGTSWLLDAAHPTKATFDTVKKSLDGLLLRCKSSWLESDWAISCVEKLLLWFDLTEEQLSEFESQFLECFESNDPRRMYFAEKIVNHLINYSSNKTDPSGLNFTEELLKKVDVDKLTSVTNSLDEDKFYFFGKLLDRLGYYNPPWLSKYIKNLDWPRLRDIILQAQTEYPHQLTKLAVSLSRLHGRVLGTDYELEYLQSIAPFVVKSINASPVDAIPNMGDLFWHALKLDVFFPTSPEPGADELKIACDIRAQLKPSIFAVAMRQLVSRDIENLARSLATLKKIDPNFIDEIAIITPKEFHETCTPDWQVQSTALIKLLRVFCVDNMCAPANAWVAANASKIDGPLKLFMAAISPETAINFHRSNLSVMLYDEWHPDWNLSKYALCRIAEIDEKICEEIVHCNLQELTSSVYKVSIDNPRHLVNFFRVLHDAFPKLFSKLVAGIDLSSPQAAKSLDLLDSERDFVRMNYRKLAKVASKQDGRLGELGSELLVRINRINR